jgi:hypothetical protein
MAPMVRARAAARHWLFPQDREWRGPQSWAEPERFEEIFRRWFTRTHAGNG